MTDCDTADRAIAAAAEGISMARVAELWAPELRQPASWLRRRLIEAAVDGLFDMEYPLIGLTLLDPTTQAQRRVSLDLADFGRSPQAADLVASFRKKRRELDLLDIVEAMTGCDLVVGRAAVLALAARWKLPAPSFWAEPAAPEPAAAESAGPDVIVQLVAYFNDHRGMPEKEAKAKCRATGLGFTKRQWAEARAKAAPESKLKRGRPRKNPIQAT